MPLSPNPSPSAAPAAIATTFLSAPHSSTPRMSSLTYRRNRRRAIRATTRSASSKSAAATTAEAGRLRATSAARLGPDSAATRATGTPAASATTSLIRSSVTRSSPLTTDNKSASGASCRARPSTVARRCADGAAKMTRSVASRSAAGSAVAITVAGSSTPGSRASFRPVAAIRAAVSGEWHRSVTDSTRATSRASVVPHAPAPTTATRGPAISGSWVPARRSPACGPMPSPWPPAWSARSAPSCGAAA